MRDDEVRMAPPRSRSVHSYLAAPVSLNEVGGINLAGRNIHEREDVAISEIEHGVLPRQFWLCREHCGSKERTTRQAIQIINSDRQTADKGNACNVSTADATAGAILNFAGATA